MKRRNFLKGLFGVAVSVPIIAKADNNEELIRQLSDIEEFKKNNLQANPLPMTYAELEAKAWEVLDDEPPLNIESLAQPRDVAFNAKPSKLVLRAEPVDDAMKILKVNK